MDNEQQYYPDSDFEDMQQEVPEKVSPFADSPYVSAYQPAAEPPELPRPKKERKSWPVLAVVAAVLIAALACNTIVMSVQNARLQDEMELLSQTMNNKLQVLQQQIESAEAPVVVPGGTVTQEGLLTPGQVYAQNVRAVVAIASQATQTNIYGQVSETASAGSGFIISQDGYVVTNHHVIEGATQVRVITYDALEYEAKVVGSDATNDIALLKIEGEDFPCVSLGSSDALAVGEQVAAIGNPLGELTSTLTVGYVSAKDRAVTTDGTAINMLQTDAAINSGNSGGPLFNMQGQVVGITTAKYSGTSSSGASIEGIGFAIPIDDVVGMLEDLREFGYVTSTYLGVMVRDVSESAQSYGLPAGAYVAEVTPGYCAEKAGVKAQDIIVNIGGYSVTSLSDLSRVLRRFEPGDTTTITVYRGGKEVNLSIILDEKPQEVAQEPEQPATTPQQDPYGGMFPDFFGDFFGGFFGNGWG